MKLKVKYNYLINYEWKIMIYKIVFCLFLFCFVLYDRVYEDNICVVFFYKFVN